MPVPVPISSRPPAHPVTKPPNNTGKLATLNHHDLPRIRSAFQYVIHTLPQRPTGPPAGFGTREEWLNSLPSWRRNKPRKLVDDKEDDCRITSAHTIEKSERLRLQHGEIDAADALVLNGERAEACPRTALTPGRVQGAIMGVFPPSLSATASYSASSCLVANDEMGPLCECSYHTDHGKECKWAIATFTQDQGHRNGRANHNAWGTTSIEYGIKRSQEHDESHRQCYAEGAFSPIREDDSPLTPDSLEALASSTTADLHESITPFAEYVDRAVSGHDNDISIAPPLQYTSQQSVDSAREQQPASESDVTPIAIRNYRVVADTLSDWIAEYVWKVCTTGMSLPPRFVGSLNCNGKQYTVAPPSYLPRAIQSLLYATLLQPSGIVLALWYIARLPVCFDWQIADPELQAKETNFRMELLGEVQHGECISKEERDTMESRAPYRLVLLGCMLANKWLDDHTFSNKTWHTISEVPIHSVNRLEFLALAILAHDLSVPPRAWDQWLSHLRSYHASLSPYPSPIGRPSTDSNLIVRKIIEDLIQVPRASATLQACADLTCRKVHPEPVFVGLGERIKEKAIERLKVDDVDPLEINLDEDGPLREEYLPRRRSLDAKHGDRTRSQLKDRSVDYMPVEFGLEIHNKAQDVYETLPPPAKWSPQADPPIERERDRSRGRYMAVQPSLTRASIATYPPHQSLHVYSEYVEPTLSASLPGWVDKHEQGFVSPTVQRNHGGIANNLIAFSQTSSSQPHCNECPPITHCPIMHHSRSHSLISSSGAHHRRTHPHSYSQSCFECDDTVMGLGESEIPSLPWYTHTSLQRPAIYPSTFDDPVPFRPTWLRT